MNMPPKKPQPGIRTISKDRLTAIAEDIRAAAQEPGIQLTEREFRTYLPGLVAAADDPDAITLRTLYTERLGGPRSPCTVVMDNGERVYVPPLREFDVGAQMRSARNHSSQLVAANTLADDYPTRAANQSKAVIEDLAELARPANTREWAARWTNALGKFGIDVKAADTAKGQPKQKNSGDLGLDDVNLFDVE